MYFILFNPDDKTNQKIVIESAKKMNDLNRSLNVRANNF